MSENSDKSNNDTIGIDVVLSVLESGHSVELPATGYSMFPTLRPGDRVVVKPLLKGELPMRGSVVVFINNGATAQGAEHRAQGGELRAQGSANSVLVMHRLVEMKSDDSGIPLFITRGDSMMEADMPWPQQQLLGVAVCYRRGKKKHLIKTFIPGELRYKYNRRMLWMYSKVMILRRMLSK